jgi:hypothetical protein
MADTTTSPTLFDEPLWSEAEYAASIRRSRRTVQRDRLRGEGPPYILIGAKPFYRPSLAREYWLAREQVPARERLGLV